MNKKAVVLLSGGVDSTTVFYYAKSKGYKCHAVIFDYGQRHIREIESAKRIAVLNKCPYDIVKFNLPWNGSALIDKETKIPFHKSKEIGKGIPSTYVPARNTIFLSFGVISFFVIFKPLLSVFKETFPQQELLLHAT